MFLGTPKMPARYANPSNCAALRHLAIHYISHYDILPTAAANWL
jgi:hypothetical protein